ncbi:MAG: guanylate kinase [Bacteroidetes bacterium]|nr:guanylate kinase [Bacteroidota bacterium]
MTTGKLILFCGPSGSGKTTIVHHLLKNNPALSFSVSATTRSKRDVETDGVDYHFLSVEEFKKKISHDEFIEWEEVYKNGFYGTLKPEVEKIWKQGKVAVFDVDVEGGLKIKKKFGDAMLAVFVMPPTVDDLHKRLHARETETPESLKARIAKSEHELTFAFRFDKVLINDDREKAFEEAQQMVNEFLK